MIDARNVLSDAPLALTELTGADARNLAALQDNIPLQPPDPASMAEWVQAAQRDNPQIRAAVLVVDAAEWDIATNASARARRPRRCIPRSWRAGSRTLRYGPCSGQ